MTRAEDGCMNEGMNKQTNKQKGFSLIHTESGIPLSGTDRPATCCRMDGLGGDGEVEGACSLLPVSTKGSKKLRENALRSKLMTKVCLLTSPAMRPRL